MVERHIRELFLEDPRLEDPSATRGRLAGGLPAGAARRMSQLGMLMASVLAGIDVGESDALVYASCYGENRTLEDYLASFPAASPTLFQMSIHPSAAQQAMILRRLAVRHFFPLTGGPFLAAHAVQTALLAPNERVVLCGGEERGTWLLEQGVTEKDAFAFAALLTADPEGAIGTIRMEECACSDGRLRLADFFAALRDRAPLRLAAAPGLTLSLTWR